MPVSQGFIYPAVPAFNNGASTLGKYENRLKCWLPLSKSLCHLMWILFATFNPGTTMERKNRSQPMSPLPKVILGSFIPSYLSESLICSIITHLRVHRELKTSKSIPDPHPHTKNLGVTRGLDLICYLKKKKREREGGRVSSGGSLHRK